MSGTFLCDEALATSGQTDHDNTYLGVLNLNTKAISTGRHPGDLWRSSGAAVLSEGEGKVSDPASFARLTKDEG